MLKNKVIIVTGAGSGIGQAAAVVFAEAGARVVIADANWIGAQETTKGIVQSGGDAVAVHVDVGSEEEIEAMLELTLARYGRLDGALNNAGIPMHRKLVDELSESEWNTVLDVNLKGMFLCMKHEIRAMRKTGGGAIVNMSSGSGVVGTPYGAEYVASKHGVIGLTRASSTEAAITGVRVNAILPGQILTPMVQELMKTQAYQEQSAVYLKRHSIGRFGQPREVGYAAKWLLSDEASFMNGAAIAVDGGYTAQ